MMRLAGYPLPEDDTQRTLARLAELSGISLDFWQAAYNGDDQALSTQSSDITQGDERVLDQGRSSFGIEDFWQISSVMLKLMRSASPERRAQILSTLAEHAREIRAGDRQDAP